MWSKLLNRWRKYSMLQRNKGKMCTDGFICKGHDEVKYWDTCTQVNKVKHVRLHNCVWRTNSKRMDFKKISYVVVQFVKLHVGKTNAFLLQLSWIYMNCVQRFVGKDREKWYLQSGIHASNTPCLFSDGISIRNRLIMYWRSSPVFTPFLSVFFFLHAYYLISFLIIDIFTFLFLHGSPSLCKFSSR